MNTPPQLHTTFIHCKSGAHINDDIYQHMLDHFKVEAQKVGWTDEEINKALSKVTRENVGSELTQYIHPDYVALY